MTNTIVRGAAVLCAMLASVDIARAGQSASIPATATTPQVPAYVARAAGTAPRPAVLLLHGCEGFSNTYVHFADDVARAGYTVVAIDSVAASGKKTACGDPTGPQTEAADATAALTWMQTQPYIDGSRIALLGYSMGSIAALDIVDSRAAPAAPAGLRAAVLYYPACRGRDPARIQVPLRIFDGDADDWIPAEPCKELASDAAAAGKNVAITTYPQATHAFNVDEPDRTYLGHHLAYNASATADAEKSMLQFLQATIGGPP